MRQAGRRAASDTVVPSRVADQLRADLRRGTSLTPFGGTPAGLHSSNLDDCVLDWGVGCIPIQSLDFQIK